MFALIRQEEDDGDEKCNFHDNGEFRHRRDFSGTKYSSEKMAGHSKCKNYTEYNYEEFTKIKP